MIELFENCLRKTSDGLNRVSIVIVGIVVMLMFSSLFLQVVARYCFNSPLTWPEELTMFLMAWMSFVGAAVAIKSWEHIGVDLLLNKLHGKAKRVLTLIIFICTLFFAGFLLIEGIELAVDSIPMLSDGMRISMFWPRLSMPVGAFLMVIHLVEMILRESIELAKESGV